MSRIEKHHAIRRDVLQLDELVAAGVGMIHDFIDHNWTDPGASVGLVGRSRQLLREMFFACADDIAAKRCAIGRRAKREAMTIPGEIRTRVAREEINIIATRTE